MTLIAGSNPANPTNTMNEQHETLIAKFKARIQPAVDYYAAWLWADEDRHRLMGLEWIATKRALRAEAEVKRLKKKVEELTKIIDDATLHQYR